MKWAFWISVCVVAYTYAGYPLLLYLRSCWAKRPVSTAQIEPTVSVVLALRNEASTVASKLHNMSLLSYPVERFEIIVVSDGSTDETAEILLSLANERTTVICCPEHVGKAEALNLAIARSRGEIVVFTDARQRLECDALRHLVANFNDPTVGCVSGELLLEEVDVPGSLRAAGLYWKFEKKIRQWESNSGSVVGATGAFYAVRRELLRPLPQGTILDDVYTPLQVVRQGHRVIFEHAARAWDQPPSGPAREFQRKVRTLTGNYQLLQLAPWLLTLENPILFKFLSHKMLRLIVPFALVGALICSLAIAEPFYQLSAVLQILLYGSAVLTLIPVRLRGLGRIANLSLTIVLLNAAAVLALVNFLTGKKEVWVR
jgi:cellulose synthase/poly-beta-1,6-N-acetylglucosamine synthase-like glycosyltransferase